MLDFGPAAGAEWHSEMRMTFFSGPRRPWRWLRVSAYYLSVLLVLSFICCEVLDLDGSDFPVPSKSHDVRRATLVSVDPWESARFSPVDDHTPLLKPDDPQFSAPVRVPARTRSRLTLPRAAPAAPAA